jgi:hypothetical protein
MHTHLTDFTWEGVAALATLIAVIVALVPIWRDARRREAQARSLRLRLCSKLTLLRPSLAKIRRGGSASYPATILTRDQFTDVVRSIADMLKESSALHPGEQDRLGLILANLELAAALYETADFTVQSADNILDLIDRAIAVMSEHGLLHGDVAKPWDDRAREDAAPMTNVEQKLTALGYFKDWSNYVLVTTVAALGWVVAKDSLPIAGCARTGCIWAFALSAVCGVLTLALIPLVGESIREDTESFYSVPGRFRPFWMWGCAASLLLKWACWPQHLLFMAGILLYALGATLR